MRDEIQRLVQRDASDFQTELQDYDNNRKIEAAGHVRQHNYRHNNYVALPCSKLAYVASLGAQSQMSHH